MVSKRVEIVARALARHRLAHHHKISPSLVASVAAAISRAEERLWPMLAAEAQAVLEAIEGPRGGSGVEEGNPVRVSQPASPNPGAQP